MRTGIGATRGAGRLGRCLLAAGIGLLGGCYRQRTVVQVCPDGSGYVALARVLEPGALAVLGKLSRYDAEASGMLRQWVGPEAVSNLAARFGPGVTLAASQTIDQSGGRGLIAVLRVERINDLRLPLAELLPCWAPPVAGADVDPFSGLNRAEPDEDLALKFTWQDGELTVTSPELPPGAPLPEGAAEPLAADDNGVRMALYALRRYDLDGAPAPAEALRAAFGGVTARTDVELLSDTGEVTARLPLLGMELDALLAHPHGPRMLVDRLEHLMRLEPAKLVEALGEIRRLPGLTLPAGPVVRLRPGSQPAGETR